MMKENIDTKKELIRLTASSVKDIMDCKILRLIPKLMIPHFASMAIISIINILLFVIFCFMYLITNPIQAIVSFIYLVVCSVAITFFIAIFYSHLKEINDICSDYSREIYPIKQLESLKKFIFGLLIFHFADFVINMFFGVLLSSDTEAVCYYNCIFMPNYWQLNAESAIPITLIPIYIIFNFIFLGMLALWCRSLNKFIETLKMNFSCTKLFGKSEGTILYTVSFIFAFVYLIILGYFIVMISGVASIINILFCLTECVIIVMTGLFAVRFKNRVDDENILNNHSKNVKKRDFISKRVNIEYYTEYKKDTQEFKTRNVHIDMYSEEKIEGNKDFNKN